jgi:hypothetical protein
VATYIELVNKAIRQAGVELDPLSAPDFANPPDPMQARFKEWVSDAWFDEQLSRKDWEFTKETAFTTIRPRIKIVNGLRTAPDPIDPILNPPVSSPPPVDSVFEGDTSGVSVTVKGVTLLSGSWAAGTAEAWLDLDDLSATTYVFGETFDELDPEPTNVDVFQLKWYGTYDLIADTASSYEINKSSFYIQNRQNESDRRRLRWVDYEEFQQLANTNTGFFGDPIAVTETPDGTFDFYPRPIREYRLWFTYTRVPQQLVDETDEPEMPPEYHELIVYRTLMYYADYDEKPQVFSRAERRYDLYKNRLNVNKLPDLQWGANRYEITQF